MTKGTYAGGTIGGPWGFGGGLYIDSHGRIYPQAYGGTPGASLSAGYTPDLEGLLTGTSVSGSVGEGAIRLNAGTSGGATGIGVGTPGVGVTYGFGPLEMSHDFSQPWAAPFVRESAAAAGVPSRYNVLEYGYPDPSPVQPSVPETAAVNRAAPSVFDTGASPVPAFSPSKDTPRGLFGRMVDAGLIDPSNPDQPPAGGLLGLIQQSMRNGLGGPAR
jgi:hypothetical protein